MPTRVLIPSGVLCLGFDRDALARGVAAKPDLIRLMGVRQTVGRFRWGQANQNMRVQ